MEVLCESGLKQDVNNDDSNAECLEYIVTLCARNFLQCLP